MKNHAYHSRTETFEDIVFENRNKDYGAYHLSKKSTKYLFIAFLISLFCFSSAFTIPLIHASRADMVNVKPEIHRTIALSPVKINNDVDYTLPAPPHAIKKPAAFSQYVVVEEVTMDEQLSITETIASTIENAPPVADLIPVVEPDPVLDEKADEKPVIIAEEPARFGDGDLNSFRSWVMDHIQYPQTAIANEISGRVFVEFCISSKGEVVDIRITRGLDESINNEVMRVLKSSPLWIPARQGGRVVKQLFSMPLVFELKKS